MTDPKESLMKSKGLKKVAEMLLSEKVMAGAGISTSAGIPDFRSPVTGLYASLEKYDLPYPEALFDINYFRKNPKPFYTLFEELYPDGKKYRPTITHCFFKLLDKKGKLLRVFTQNIDTLEHLSGLDEERIVEAHGSFAKARCMECKTKVSKNWLEAKVRSGEVARCEMPTCQKKSSVPAIKPDITFFGENLPERFFRRISDFHRADLLLVMGTSLVVQPFASLIDEVPAYCPRALFNLEKVGEGIGPGLFSKWNNLGEEGFDFSTPGTRDIFCQGKVDDTIRALAELCGWKDELETLFEEMNTGMDKLHAEEKEDEDDTTHSKDDTDALVEKLAVASINDVESSKEKL